MVSYTIKISVWLFCETKSNWLPFLYTNFLLNEMFRKNQQNFCCNLPKNNWWFIYMLYLFGKTIRATWHTQPLIEQTCAVLFLLQFCITKLIYLFFLLIIWFLFHNHKINKKVFWQPQPNVCCFFFLLHLILLFFSTKEINIILLCRRIVTKERYI